MWGANNWKLCFREISIQRMTWKCSLNILETLETFMKNRFEILFHQKQELMGTVFEISYMYTCEHRLKLLWDFFGNIIENICGIKLENGCRHATPVPLVPE